MNRKGISPIIAVLLLVIIAVAAAILTYLWVLGYIGTVQQQGGTESLQERIKIEGIEVDTTNNYITVVYVRNIGDVQTTIDMVYLLDPSGVVDTANVDVDIAPQTLATINQDEAGNPLQLAPTGGLQPGVTYIVKVVTETGAEATYTFTYRV